jgi:hypothetical protein
VSESAAESTTFTESDVVDHRLVGARLRPPASDAVIAKSVAAGVGVGLSEELAETLAHAAADQQQLRRALRAPRIQRFGAEEFTYVEFDVVTWRILPSPDNIRFEDEHARGMINMPRFGALDGQPLLTFEMDSTKAVIDAMAPRIVASTIRIAAQMRGFQHRGHRDPRQRTAGAVALQCRGFVA